MPRARAVPPQDEAAVTVLGLRDIRYWGDETSPALVAEGKAAFDRELALWRQSGHTGPLPPANYLAISGGSEDGAFGAGLLVGWTELGSRPQFKLATGISTGALTAPFAFLGPRYDPQLRRVFTETSARSVLTGRGLLGFGILAALTGDALYSNAPLRKTIGLFVTQAMLDDIAAAYRQGRVLLVGTTNLDAGRPVIWNIGKLAASGRPGVLHLIHQILIASAAIPGAFPPEMIDVEVDGRRYQEMHVDGGASAQVFVLPPSLQVNAEAARRNISRVRHLYVIRNARREPQFEETKRSTFSIATRAISSLIQTQGIGDLYRIYIVASRDGMDFNLARIPATFTMKLRRPFDQRYMQALYDVGYQLGRKGYPWARFPPGYQELGAGPTPSATPGMIGTQRRSQSF
ncbi:MAG: patatin-like phospholipase family protein [Acetobacteraceae bacterium]